jgi:hypothetical protein
MDRFDPVVTRFDEPRAAGVERELDADPRVTSCDATTSAGTTPAQE